MSAPRTQPPTAPVLVAACGNPWAGDDAFGPAVAQWLEGWAPEHVQVADLGLKPAGLLDLELEKRSLLILVDAVEAAPPDAGRGDRPAAEPWESAVPLESVDPSELIVLEFSDGRRPPLVRDRQWSSHGLSLADELTLAERLGQAPRRTILVGAPLQSAEVGRPPGPQVRGLVPIAAETILRLAEAERLGPEPPHA